MLIIKTRVNGKIQGRVPRMPEHRPSFLPKKSGIRKDILLVEILKVFSEAECLRQVRL